ncbi:hypothetical protein SAY86_006163 [Trapa natans]|uniref:TF-B3 domain-containing protein n=1 Tax=Trapa natans TaxID=22666 RepID=A0AAN7L4R4_TRANT|nr:hypothetical protein SAY86_006163 [Trapa natans]
MEQLYGGDADHGKEAVVPVLDTKDEEDDACGGGGGGCGADDEILDETLPFYAPDFPPMPDFPCMSSSSSSSSTRAPVKANCPSPSSSSSSAASWAILKSDHEGDPSPPMPSPAPLPVAVPSTAPMDMILPEEGAKLEQAKRDKGKQVMEEVPGFDHCLDMMETFGYKDLLECNDLFDLSIFQREEPVNIPTAANNGYPIEQFLPVQHQMQPPKLVEVQPYEEKPPPPPPPPPLAVAVRGGADEMGQVLLEWLRNNRDSISAEDLRKIKIKKATIDAAARRLGGGKAAMKQLLKLILEWVQTNHLRRKKQEAAQNNNSLSYYPFQELPDLTTFQNPNPINGFASGSTSCFPQAQWPSPYVTAEHAVSVMAAQATFAPPNVGYIGGGGGDLFSGIGDLYSGVAPGMADYHMLNSPAGQSSWRLPQFGPPATNYYSFLTGNANFQPQVTHAFAGYPNNLGQFTNFQHQQQHQQQQQYYGNGNNEERSLIRLGSSSMTKEARKKRMARQRQLNSHHNHLRIGRGQHGSQHATHQNGHNQAVMPMDHQQHARAMGGCDQAGAAVTPGNWVYWPAQAPALAPPTIPPPMLPPESIHIHQQQTMERQLAAVQGQTGQRAQVALDRRPGWKPGNNLKLLLQKVLKQSDVGSLGRIVLPKKEAEMHLPELEARDGISILMEDIGTSRVWNMRYRYWPNNKSRMYLLENTGDFVRANGLQEGDFIVIYSDVKCGKYLIRGVKVRATEGGAKSKSESKRPEIRKPRKNRSRLDGKSSTAASPSNAAKSK